MPKKVGKMKTKIVLKKHHDVYKVVETHNTIVEQKSLTKKEVEELVKEKADNDFTIVIRR